jgi:hypothetical protein
MLLYQVRRRHFRLERDTPLAFPCQCEATFVFLPKQAFGEEAGGGRTVVQGGGGQLYFNFNSGYYHFVSEHGLQPLDVRIEEGDSRLITLHGTGLTIGQPCDSLKELDQLVEAVYHIVPALLAVHFADPPYIERVYGRIGDVPFRWELAQMAMPLRVTNQDEQERAVIRAWKDFHEVLPLSHRRLAGALHYFHVALRLGRAGQVAGEFLPEMLLNLAKSLEVLFHPGRRDDVRAGLAALGFETEWGEKYIVPAIALRNELDVGHVTLAVFSQAQLEAVHAYVEQAEERFRDLFSRVLERFRDGTFVPAPYDDAKPSRKALRLIRRLHEAFAR